MNKRVKNGSGIISTLLSFLVCLTYRDVEASVDPKLLVVFLDPW